MTEQWVTPEDFKLTEFPALQCKVNYPVPSFWEECKVRVEKTVDWTSKGDATTLYITRECSGRQKFDYDPFENAGLFASFARIRSEKDACAWVAKNGFLRRKDNEKGLEDYTYFMEEVAQARQLWELFNAVVVYGISGTAEKRKELINRFRIVKNPQYEESYVIDYSLEQRYPRPLYLVEVDGVVQPERYSDWRIRDPEQLFHYVMYYIGQKIVDKLQSVHFSFYQVESTSENLIPWRVAPCFWCEDLITMMYLRFYWLVTTDAKLKRCEKCKELFIPDSGKQIYCGNCRTIGDPAREMQNQRRKEERVEELAKFATTYGGSAPWEVLVSLWNKQAPKRNQYKTAKGFRRAVIDATKKKGLDCSILLDKE